VSNKRDLSSNRISSLAMSSKKVKELSFARFMTGFFLPEKPLLEAERGRSIPRADRLRSKSLITRQE
jgi:hypothetical protein